MVKAFKVFGVKMSYFGEMTHSHDTDEYYSDSSDISVQSREDNDFFENEKILSRHIRCCAHTLSLCATNDIIKTIKKSPNLQEIHNQIMYKCNVLWNAAGRPKSAEVLFY